MKWLIPGSLAFVCFAVSDFGKHKRTHVIWTLLFVIGELALVFSTVAMIPWLGIWHRLISYFIYISGLLIFAAGLLGMLAYVLFFALPFKRTYLQQRTELLRLVDSGPYGLCRHPGVILLGLSYFIMFLITQDTVVLFAFLIYTLLDIAYVVWQDCWLFPKTISGYSQYKQNTPFLIPNRKSIKRFVDEIKIKRRS